MFMNLVTDEPGSLIHEGIAYFLECFHPPCLTQYLLLGENSSVGTMRLACLG